MKKEIIGFVCEYSDAWLFETETDYYYNVPVALDELLGVETQNGEKYKITIEKLS